MTDSISKILIVDDLPANLVAMKKLLSKIHAEIYTASSGNEALSLIIDHDFALILLDVQMPGMDGFETAEIMRSSDYARITPIIFVTAISKEQQHVFRGYDSGAVDYMFKPVEPKVLQSKVAVFLELDRQKKDLLRTHEKLRQEIALRSRAEQEKDELISKLKAALAEVKTLRGILPICSKCHNIRDDDGYWQQIEKYISEHSEAVFSHGMCEKCCDELFAGQDWYDKSRDEILGKKE